MRNIYVWSGSQFHSCDWRPEGPKKFIALIESTADSPLRRKSLLSFEFIRIRSGTNSSIEKFFEASNTSLEVYTSSEYGSPVMAALAMSTLPSSAPSSFRLLRKDFNSLPFGSRNFSFNGTSPGAFHFLSRMITEKLTFLFSRPVNISFRINECVEATWIVRACRLHQIVRYWYGCYWKGR